MATQTVYTGTCDTMTFEEAWEAITTGKPFIAVLRGGNAGLVEMYPVLAIWAADGVIQLDTGSMTLYWTADEISSVKPSSPS